MCKYITGLAWHLAGRDLQQVGSSVRHTNLNEHGSYGWNIGKGFCSLLRLLYTTKCATHQSCAVTSGKLSTQSSKVSAIAMRLVSAVMSA